MGKCHVEHEERKEEVADTTGDVKSTHTPHLQSHNDSLQVQGGRYLEDVYVGGVYGKRTPIHVYMYVMADSKVRTK